MSAPDIAPEFARLARLAAGGLEPEGIPKGRRPEALTTLRLRHRGTSLDKVAAPVPMRVIRPKGATGRLPALLLVHGGGYVFGRARMDDRIASRFAKELGIAVVSVDYRLAPENPYPAGLEDAHAGLVWLASQPWVEATRIAVGGASAGGGLAASLAQHAHDRGAVDVAFQLLVYPMLDDRTPDREDIAAGDHRIWNKDADRTGWTAYLGQPSGTEAVPDAAVPSRRRDLTGLPPAWIGVGSADLFHDECVAYAQRLEDAGVEVDLTVAEGAVHGFERFAPRKQASRRFAAQQVEALRRGLRLQG
ncbi:MAG: Esterase LipW [Frankiales bacterium]|nr:Esterase LipW [Frankiales bacterium]